MARLDIVIFGATGFTGKQTVIHMIDFAEKYDIGSWGVAGRSASKLENLMKEVAEKTGKPEAVRAVKLLIADVDDEQSLNEMCSQAKVLVNCCGPYRLYGEPVVKAAIENGTHYVDISGEPQFMELMQLRYGEMARNASVYVVSACGWDSIPSDMGVMFLKKNFEGTLNSVRSYLSAEVPPEAMEKSEGRGIINYGTWESLVYGIKHINELPGLRKQLYPKPLPPLQPKLYRATMHKKDGEGDYYLPFLGADESVVFRTQHYLHFNEGERPVQFKIYFKSGGFFATNLTMLGAGFLFVMAKLSCTRNLLLKYPKFFSLGRVTKQGPVDVVMNNTYFTFDMIGEGWEEGADVENTKPNKRVMAKVSGVNPAYGATCVALLSSALTVLRETDKMPDTNLHKLDGTNEYYLPFLGSDESVVYRTQRYLFERESQRPIQFKAYFKAGNAITAISLAIFAILLYVMTAFDWGTKLLLKYPKFFSFGYISREGPTEEVMKSSRFKFVMIGEGWSKNVDPLVSDPDKKIMGRVSGTNPGYGATCVALLSAAIVILHEKKNLTGFGGVVTPGVAFKNTNIMKYLTENDIKFEII